MDVVDVQHTGLQSTQTRMGKVHTQGALDRHIFSNISGLDRMSNNQVIFFSLAYPTIIMQPLDVSGCLGRCAD